MSTTGMGGQSLRKTKSAIIPVRSTFQSSSMIVADKAPPSIIIHIKGSVIISHFRRPSVSMVRMAGRPKTKFTAPGARISHPPYDHAAKIELP